MLNHRIPGLTIRRSTELDGCNKNHSSNSQVPRMTELTLQTPGCFKPLAQPSRYNRFDGGHFGHGGRFTGNFHEHGRRVFSRSPSYGDEESGRTGCRCTELSCCDGGD